MTLNKTLWAALVAAMALGAASAQAADTAATKKKKKLNKTTAAAVQKKKAAVPAAKAGMKPAAAKAAAPAPVVEPVVAPAAAVAVPVAAPAPVPAPAPAPAPVVAAPAAAAPAGGLMAGHWLANVYAGGSIGQSRWSFDNTGNASVDKTGNVVKVFAGHRYSELLAAEVGYVNLGKSRVSQDSNTYFSDKTSGLFMDAVLTYGIYPKVELLGRAGVAYMDNTLNYQQSGDVTANESGNKKSFGLKVGGGVQYELMPRLRLRGEVESYPYKRPATATFPSENSRVTAVSVGATWQF